MAISTQSVNRVSISDLPSAQGVKDDDFLILQSDGVSSKIQISDLKLDRANISFYNEIADLNRVTTTNTLEINSIKQSLSATSTSTPAGEPAPSNQTRIDQLEAQLAEMKGKIKTLEDAQKLDKANLQTQITGINSGLDIIRDDVAQVRPSLAETKADLTDELATTSALAAELKSKQKLILQGVIRNSADQNSAATKQLISELIYESD
tara:strand:- start:50 stop:673 length:624 start_codon:yes stop_codon:yes gene_type:complete